MTMRMKQVLTIGAFVAILVIGAGVAAADSIGNDQDAFLNNVAKRLNVTPAALKAALKGANDDRIDAAVAAGKITKEQGDAMKARAAEGGIPFFGGGRAAAAEASATAGPASLDAAAKYLGLTEARAPHPARVGQDARRDRQGAGEDGRRPQEGADRRHEDQARRGRQGRHDHAGAGGRPPEADDGSPRRSRQRQGGPGMHGDGGSAITASAARRSGCPARAQRASTPIPA